MNLLDRVAPTTLGKAPAWLPVALQGRPRRAVPVTGMGQEPTKTTLARSIGELPLDPQQRTGSDEFQRAM